VTANKALIAAHGPELAALARQNRTRLDFEAAVGGGIPVVRALRDTLSSSAPRAIRGILNGTTNFILTRLELGAGFDDALADAQRLGYAEADPTRDLAGADAADKIAILAWLGFGVDPSRLPVTTRGLQGIADRVAADARAHGGVPRLVAEASLQDGRVTARVEPSIVAADGEFGRTRDERNLVVVDTRWNGNHLARRTRRRRFAHRRGAPRRCTARGTAYRGRE
jgi:homoserine dehydrogenase